MNTTLRAIAFVCSLSCFCLGGASCGGLYHDDAYVTGTTLAGLSIRPDAKSVLADGATMTRIVVRVPAGTRTERRQVAVSTSGGAFAEGAGASQTVTVGDGDSAAVFLRAPVDVGLQVVRAATGSATAQDTISFTRANPTTVQVEPDHFSVKATATDIVKLTATLRRSSGRVSTGTPVTFTVADANGQAADGRFGTPTLSDASGGSTVTFVPGATAFRGTLTITATSGGVTGQTKVDVTAP